MFISTQALNTLLLKATSIFCVFLSPDDSFTERKVYEPMQKNSQTDDTTGDEYSDDFLTLSAGHHLYWKNRVKCKLNKCIPSGSKAMQS